MWDYTSTDPRALMMWCIVSCNHIQQQKNIQATHIYTFCTKAVNYPLQSNGNIVYHQALSSETQNYTKLAHLSPLDSSQYKQRSFTYTKLTDWSL